MVPEDRRVARLRLASQHVSDPSLTSPAEAVQWMVALQAQNLESALWSVALRTRSVTRAQVLGALESGEIVRSWPMRGTLHFLSPADLGWILELTSSRILQRTAARRRALGLDDDHIESARAATIKSLQGGEHLTRAQIYSVFEGAGIAPTQQRGTYLLQHLSLSKTLCFGPPDGPVQRFALFDEWVGESLEREREEALGEFVLRYFRSHGPATIRDFAWWSSLTLSDSRTGLEVVQDQLESLPSERDRGGEQLYFDPSSLPHPDTVRLLPGFDEYILGYQDRRPQLSLERATAIVPGNNGVFRPTVVSDGEVVGTWDSTRNVCNPLGTAVRFGEMTAALEREIASALTCYRHFLGQNHV